MQGLGVSLNAQSKTIASFSSVEVKDKQRKKDQPPPFPASVDFLAKLDLINIFDLTFSVATQLQHNSTTSMPTSLPTSMQS